MNLEQVKAMSDDELSKKIFQICGFKQVIVCYNDLPLEEGGGMVPRYSRIPHYSNDLNAMHQLEALTLHTHIEKWLKYVDILRRMDDPNFGGACKEISATARQRAEAFVLAMEKK